MAHYRWIVLAVLFAARAATGFQFQSVGSVADPLIRDLAIGYVQVGLLLGAYLLPGVIVAFPAGLLGQRIREKSLGLFGLGLMAISGFALAGVDGFAGALSARLVGGVGATIVVLVATKMVTDWFDGRETVLAMSILQMSWPFGAMLALPVQALVAQSFGWPAVMASSGLCALVALTAFACTSSISHPQARAMPRAKLSGTVLAPLLVAGVIWGFMNLACVLFFSYAPPLIVARGFSPTAAAALASLSIWLTILAIPSGGYLVHRLGRPIAAIAVCGLLAAILLSSFVLDIYPMLSCLAFGIAIGPLSGAILSLPARLLRPGDRSLGFGVFYTCFYVLMAAGPAVAGRLQDALGLPSVGLVVAAALLAATMPLSLAFAVLADPRRLAERDGDNRRAAEAGTVIPAVAQT
jgi:predicted MFS family arabinose efflux permease